VQPKRENCIQYKEKDKKSSGDEIAYDMYKTSSSAVADSPRDALHHNKRHCFKILPLVMMTNTKPCMGLRRQLSFLYDFGQHKICLQQQMLES